MTEVTGRRPSENLSKFWAETTLQLEKNASNASFSAAALPADASATTVNIYDVCAGH